MKVLSKLNEARKILHAQKLIKTGRNDFAHYSYFELSDFLPQSLSAFDQVGLCGIVSFDIELATLRIVDISTGESIYINSPMSTAELKGCHAVQNLGAVQTYLRRYLWSAAMELIEQDPVDAAEGTSARPAITRPAIKFKLAERGASAPRNTTERLQEPPGKEGEEIWNTVIVSIKEIEGVGKNKKPYTRWELDLENGQKISTFDRKIAENLTEGASARLIVKKDGKFHSLVGVEESTEELKKPATGTAGESWQCHVTDVTEDDRNGTTFYSVSLDNEKIAWTKDRALAAKAYEFVPDTDEEPRMVDVRVKKGLKSDTLYLESINEAFIENAGPEDE